MWPNTVSEFEKVVADYAGAPYAVAVDSCTNAIFLSLRLWKIKPWGKNTKSIVIPKRTYVGVAHAIINAGYKCEFEDRKWNGSYFLCNTAVVDAARRFTSNMFKGGEWDYYCLSFHWSKHLSIGRGGMILLWNEDDANLLKRMRFDGRTEGVLATADTFDVPGYHMVMHPDDAARGLALMHSMPEHAEDLPNDNYADLSKFKIFN